MAPNQIIGHFHPEELSLRNRLTICFIYACGKSIDKNFLKLALIEPIQIILKSYDLNMCVPECNKNYHKCSIYATILVEQKVGLIEIW